MNKIMKSTIKSVTICGLLLAACVISLAQQTFTTSPADLGIHSGGLKESTPEELKALHKNKIKLVRPNRLAVDRANIELRKQGKKELDKEAADANDEVVLEGAGAQAISLESAAATTLSAIPAQVDNSILSAFPPIGQQFNGSCVAWASTYYQMSHETCLARGCNNKTSSSNRFSPKWTYNMINSGFDGGSYLSDAYSLLEKHGAANIEQLPQTAGDYLAWDLNPADWQDAISYRMNPQMVVMNLDQDSGLANAKQLLANGHVLAASTYAGSWVFRDVGRDPNVPSPFAGQAIIMYQQGTEVGHAITIVGYDDTIWDDLNFNGVVDSGEKGAFKIANSWGDTWANNGYVWVSYDAIKWTSAVPGVPSAGRRPVFTSSAVLYMSAKGAYHPKLLAEFTINHAQRGDLKMSLGSSPTSATSPTAFWGAFALNWKGGMLAFDGGSTAIDGTFVFDLTDLVPVNGGAQNYYLLMNDFFVGYPGLLKSFKVVDPNRSQEYLSVTPMPLTADANTVIASTTYEYVPDTQAPTMSSFVLPATWTFLNVPINHLSATDNVQVAGYLVAESSSIPAWDAPGWSKISPTAFVFSGGGAHTLYAWAKDANGNVSTNMSATVVITVDNIAPTITGFLMPANATSLTVPITQLTATDAVGVVGYIVNESSTAPSLGAAGWSQTAPTAYTFASEGLHRAYAWAKDANGNISAAASTTVSIIVPDTIAPTVNVFALPTSATSLTIAVAFSATDNKGVAGYVITESSTTPSTNATGWSVQPPTTFTFSGGAGVHTAYAWAKDAAGNVSAGLSATTTILGGDLVLPNVSIASPTSGSTVKSIVTVKVSSTDNVGVVRVEFYVDGSMNAISLAAPYKFYWNSDAWPNGTYVFTAKAYDAAGNFRTSAPIPVIVNRKK